MDGVLQTSINDDKQIKSPTTYESEKYVEVDPMNNDLYHEECQSEHLPSYAINIKSERNMYTTLITIEFRQQKEKESLNPAQLHRDVFTEILLIDPTTKIVTNNVTIFTKPKELYLDKEYAQSFTAATERNHKFNTIRAYVCCNIETATLYNKLIYNNDGRDSNLFLLRKHNI